MKELILQNDEATNKLGKDIANEMIIAIEKKLKYNKA